jgi:HAE1 family hydrophobic/amphiphilic exporter-1
MLPLTLGIGVEIELLQPAAIVIVSGLSFAMLVTLVLIPAVYKLAHPIAINPNMVSANDE